MAATTVTLAPPSIGRIVWNGVKKKPVMPAFIVFIALLWVANIGLALLPSLTAHPLALDTLAPDLGQGMCMLSFTLFIFAETLAASPDAAASWRRGRVRRWLRSADTTIVDLSGVARERAEQRAADKTASDVPTTGVIALPLFAGLSAALAGFSAALLFADFFVGGPTFLSARANAIFWTGMLSFYLVMTLGSVGRTSLKVYNWANERAAAAARARADVERARLAALQAQMNPHFLFNTLNTVAALAGPDSPHAESVVEHLSTVLRHSLQRANRPFTSVADELQFVHEYLDVEHARLGSRLNVTWDIQADTSNLRVPTMVLQPLIENAITHAIETRADGGHIHIASTRTAGEYLLRLSIEDNGPGFPAEMKDGVGLGDLRRRLRHEYGRACELDTETLPTGARVIISIPAVPFDEVEVNPMTRTDVHSAPRTADAPQ